MGFTGVLKDDSPALFRCLQGLFAEKPLAELALVFTRTFSLGGFSEAPVQRVLGASFNPKPARLCHILLNEFKEANPLVLSAAFLFCVEEKLLKEVTDLPQSVVELAASAHSHQFFKHHNGDKKNLSAESLLLAKKLDEFRHLHMSTLDQDEKEAFVKNIAEEILPFISLPEHERVKVLLNTLRQKYLRGKHS